jgi:hypothetical protein
MSIEDVGSGGIQGQILRLSERREVAIYLRAGRLWIADFIDGEGELVEPREWFRFNCGTPNAVPARRRMEREAAIPLSSGIAERIERLHRQAEAAAEAGECEPPPVGPTS